MAAGSSRSVGLRRANAHDKAAPPVITFLSGGFVTVYFCRHSALLFFFCPKRALLKYWKPTSITAGAWRGSIRQDVFWQRATFTCSHILDIHPYLTTRMSGGAAVTCHGLCSELVGGGSWGNPSGVQRPLASEDHIHFFCPKRSLLEYSTKDVQALPEGHTGYSMSHTEPRTEQKNPQSAAEEGVTSGLGLRPLRRPSTRDGAIHASERWRRQRRRASRA